VTGQLISRSRTDILLPPPAIAEIEYGLARLLQPARRKRPRRRFDVVLAELGRVEWTDAVGRAFGEIKAGLERCGARLEDFDVALAVHALAWGAALVTDNLSDLSRIQGLPLDNWRLG